MSEDGKALEEFGRLLGIMRKLRARGGCPWDAEQTIESLRRYILEEAHELVEAIDSGREGDITEECGDLLLQVVFIAAIASEKGSFDMEKICRAICEKLIKRHPHVFGGVKVNNADDVSRNWEIIKSDDRHAKGADDSAMAGIPKGLPALLRALRISERAAKKGFDWRQGDIESVRAKVLEELDELRAEVVKSNTETTYEELGDVLFAAANMSRHLKMDPEGALQQANEKFISRFRTMENLAEKENLRMENATLDKLETLWLASKKIENESGRLL